MGVNFNYIFEKNKNLDIVKTLNSEILQSETLIKNNTLYRTYPMFYKQEVDAEKDIINNNLLMIKEINKKGYEYIDELIADNKNYEINIDKFIKVYSKKEHKNLSKNKTTKKEKGKEKEKINNKIFKNEKLALQLKNKKFLSKKDVISFINIKKDEIIEKIINKKYSNGNNKKQSFSTAFRAVTLKLFNRNHNELDISVIKKEIKSVLKQTLYNYNYFTVLHPKFKFYINQYFIKQALKFEMKEFNKIEQDKEKKQKREKYNNMTDEEAQCWFENRFFKKYEQTNYTEEEFIRIKKRNHYPFNRRW